MSDQHTKGQPERDTEVEGYITADLGLGLNINLAPLDSQSIGVGGGAALGADFLAEPGSNPTLEQLAKLRLA
jgi:hypothetical protein